MYCLKTDNKRNKYVEKEIIQIAYKSRKYLSVPY